MKDKNFLGIRSTAKPFLFLFGTLLLILIASPVCAQALSVTATATPTSGVAPLDVAFASTVSGGTAPYTYLWEFGDTQTSSQPSPSHTYNTPGTYTARLTVTDSASTPATVVRTVATITVFLPVTASADPVCGTAPSNVCFSGEASGGAEPYRYLWSFGDGAPANNTGEQNPCHGYMNIGNYNVTLSVTDAAGNTGSANLVIYVYDDDIPFTPRISADALLGLAPMRVNFFGSVQGPAGFVYTYSWDFGDGGTCQDDQNPQYIYAEPGVYMVTLTVNGTDPLGVCMTDWSDSATIEIVVASDPSVYITNPEGGDVFTGSSICFQSMALASRSILRVDYFIDGQFVGSSSTGPDYRICLEACGVNGTFNVTAMVYVNNGTSAESAPVAISVYNPTLDGTNFVMKNPYKVKFFGDGFKVGAKLYINGYQVPATKVLNSSIIIAKGGRALKNMMPKGVPVLITVENLDGGCTNTITFQR